MLRCLEEIVGSSKEETPRPVTRPTNLYNSQNEFNL